MPKTIIVANESNINIFLILFKIGCGRFDEGSLLKFFGLEFIKNGLLP